MQPRSAPDHAHLIGLFLFGGLVLAGASARSAETNQPVPVARYEIRAAHDPNGIGKFYLGREIAQVMGHQAADWLERPEREQEERSDLLLSALKLKAGDVVADIGCGSGYYTRRLAKLVGNPLTPSLSPSDEESFPRSDHSRLEAQHAEHLLSRPAATLPSIPNGGEGRGEEALWFKGRASEGREQGIVYAVEIQPEMLDLLTNKLAAEKIFNVKPILGTITDPKLPRASVDLILMVDVYHEFDHPFEMIEAMCQSLQPGGRIVFVEFRGEDPNVPIKLVHKMTEAQVRKEMRVHPLDWVETIGTLPQQHIIVFRKRP